MNEKNAKVGIDLCGAPPLNFNPFANESELLDDGTE